MGFALTYRQSPATDPLGRGLAGGNKQFCERKVRKMSRMLTMAVALGAMTLGFTGCAEKASTTTEKTVSTPQGETTTKTETTVEKSGDNPPPAN